MKEYSGMLYELGPSKDTGARHYSYIKIGDHLLTKIAIDSSFDTVLKGEFGKYPTLWVIETFGRLQIVGITQEDGQTFRQSTGKYTGVAIMMLLMTLICLVAYVDSRDSVRWIYLVLMAFLAAVMWLGISLAMKIRRVPATHVF